jgi:hypothetical protein
MLGSSSWLMFRRWLLLYWLPRVMSRLLYHLRPWLWLLSNLRLRTRLMNHLLFMPWLLYYLRPGPWLLHHLRLRTRLALNLRRQRMPFWSRHFNVRLFLRPAPYAFALGLLFLLLKLHALRLLRGALLIDLLLALFLLELLHLPARVLVALRRLRCKFSFLLLYTSRLLPVVPKVQLFISGFFRNLVQPHYLRQVFAERRRRRRHARNHARVEKFLRDAWRQIGLAAAPR